LAAGLDKNAECINSLSQQGFGFIECGTVTINPQKGNPKPRMFRLIEDKALINRLGFNNDGIDVFLKNVERSKKNTILGINIGRNKDTPHPTDDYIKLIEKVNNHCDYIVLNVSSPNTIKLRNLQQADLLKELLEGAFSKNKSTPIVLKISPDIDNDQKESIARLSLEYKVSAITINNTTIGCRDHLINSNKAEYGGLSGKPLFETSLQLLKDMYLLTNRKIPLISSGGISDAETAYKKIKNGATLLQIYTALIYNGFGLINKINADLIELLKKDGFRNIKEAIGSDI
jgi:dihydroorotate dehydrogenase